MPSKPTVTYDPANIPVTLLLVHAAKLWEQKLRRLLAKFSLTLPQLGVLVNLKYADAHASQRTIADLVGSDVMTISQVIRLLEKKKLVTRTKDEKDSRAYRVHITLRGSRLVEKLVPVLQEAKTEFMEPISSKESQLVSLLKQLNQHNQHIS